MGLRCAAASSRSVGGFVKAVKSWSKTQLTTAECRSKDYKASADMDPNKGKKKELLFGSTVSKYGGQYYISGFSLFS